MAPMPLGRTLKGAPTAPEYAGFGRGRPPRMPLTYTANGYNLDFLHTPSPSQEGSQTAATPRTKGI